jgi:hypothetical protein
MSPTPTVQGSFRIMPSDIDATRHFFSAFGHAETEFAALGVVLFCQAKGSWTSFTEAELADFFRAARDSGTVFPFNSHWSSAMPEVLRADREVGAARLFMSPDGFRFRDLNPESGLLVRLGRDGRYRVTELFIERCHKSSPKP